MDRTKTLRIAVRKFEPFETTIDEVWREFVRQTECPLRLEAVALDLHPLHDAILDSGGMRDGAWDLVQINSDWIAEAHQSGATASLDDFLSNDPPEGYPDAWSASLLDAQRFDGRLVALPFHDGPECLIYRKDLFENRDEQRNFRELTGSELTVPQTWEQFLRVAEFFHRPEQNLYGTIIAAYPDGHNTVFDCFLQLWTHGGEPILDDGSIVLSGAATQRGLEFYRRLLHNRGVLHPRSRDCDSVQTGMAFAAGEVALMVNWFGFAAMCEVIEESRVKGRVDVTHIPYGSGGASVSLNAYWMYAIAAGSPHRQWAYRFMKYVTSAANDKRLTENGGIGCRKTTWHDAQINAEIPYFSRLEQLHRVARTLPRKSYWAEIADVIDELMLKTMNTDEPVERLLSTADSKIETIQGAHRDT